ncbi:MAG: UDP-N-acetylmuramoyl-L-alanyl-D-glutamate--2,6-diaminopimelate ligase [Oscillospiraceae bacterium]|nr:UDP-N-acetylmuramoyl-L-alanyl-D-glutamate--2,6-diaminopimelate ligase [Oscillospiraceae bacterium]
MLLSEILKGVEYTAEDFFDTEITDVVYDSRKAKDGAMFVALVGAFSDGHDYISSAVLSGSKVILAQRKTAVPQGVQLIVTADTRAALSVISANFFSHPEKELKIIGVTGTKGKTSIAGMLGECLNNAGMKCGTIGTVGAYYDGKIFPTANTTPESFECMRLFRDMINAGCKVCVMEVSSLGLKAHRVDDIRFDAAVFTNLSPDHIGGNEHKDFEEYAYWKKQLFYKCGCAVLNKDDAFSKELKEIISVPCFEYSVFEKADFYAENIQKLREKGFFGASFTCVSGETQAEMKTAVPGLFSVSNALACIAVCKILGVETGVIQKSLEKAKVLGRNNCLDIDADFDVIIDYAHNGQSFNSVIDTFSEYEHSRIITVFGSVGDRAFLRREELGLISGKRADLSIITTDDPGFEDPESICAQIASYVQKAGGEYKIIVNREEAVKYALSVAGKGDMVLLLGKGHEDFMKVKGKKEPYSDYESVKKYFEERV